MTRDEAMQAKIEALEDELFMLEARCRHGREELCYPWRLKTRVVPDLVKHALEVLSIVSAMVELEASEELEKK